MNLDEQPPIVAEIFTDIVYAWSTAVVSLLAKRRFNSCAGYCYIFLITNKF